MTESAEASDPLAPPVTGNHDIDRALASLDLGDDVAEHPARIAAALDVVQRALSGSGVPSALRLR